MASHGIWCSGSPKVRESGARSLCRPIRLVKQAWRRQGAGESYLQDIRRSRCCGRQSKAQPAHRRHPNCIAPARMIPTAFSNLGATRMEISGVDGAYHRIDIMCAATAAAEVLEGWQMQRLHKVLSCFRKSSCGGFVLCRHYDPTLVTMSCRRLQQQLVPHARYLLRYSEIGKYVFAKFDEYRRCWPRDRVRI